VCEGLRASRETVDSRVLSAVRRELLSPTAILRMQERIRGALHAHAQETRNLMANRQARIAELRRRIARLIEAVETTGISSSDYVPSDLLARYKRAVTDLRGSLTRDAGRAQEILRDLLGEIRLQPEGEEIYAEFATRPEQVFLSERVASHCGCGGAICEIESLSNQRRSVRITVVRCHSSRLKGRPSGSR
jgi:hypothetical protein